MNEFNSIPLTKITIPAVTDAEYASGIHEAFNNINDNFTILANNDFVKGDPGTSVKVTSMPIYDEDGMLTVIGQQLKDCIEAASTENERVDVVYGDGENDKLTLWDNFTAANAGSVNMIYSTEVINDEPLAVSSLYYVFNDGRYVNDRIGNIDSELYNNIRDLSCIVVYDLLDEETSLYGFKILSNTFPTIYYKPSVGLCWKVNGNPTGLPVQGIPGKDGLNSILNIVKCNNDTSNGANTGVVTHVFSIYDGYTSINDVEDIDIYDNAAALILMPSASTNDSDFYFGFTHKSGSTLYAQYETETAITYGVKVNEILNAMKNMKLVGANSDVSAGLKGLFIPIDDAAVVNGVQTQPVHLLTATSISNMDGVTNDDRNDIVFTPINNINSLNVDDNHSLNVDKYLYLQAYPKHDIFDASNSYVFSDCKDSLEASNYTLKYKLTNIITDVNSNAFIDEWHNGSRYFGSITDPDMGIPVPLNDGNVAYYNVLPHEYGMSGAASMTTDHIHTFKKTFADRMTGFQTTEMGAKGEPLGIYRWDLCTEAHSFDPKELANAEKTDNKYKFPDVFSTVYTTTINPGVSTEFMWFNGMQLVREGFYKGISFAGNIDGYVGNGLSKTYIIPGWNDGSDNNNMPVFSFLKFIPVYNNDFALEKDTALNLNYNVNITGDELNAKRNITVHGSVNCDDLSVYNLTAAGEIKRVYTTNDIRGEAGILLGMQTNENDEIEPACTIDAGGGISANSMKLTNVLDCAGKTIITTDAQGQGSILTQTLETSTFKVKPPKSTIPLYTITSENGTTIKIDAQNVDSFTITPAFVAQNSKPSADDTDKVPVLTNNMPLLQNDNTPVIVTNQHRGSDQLCYNGVFVGQKKGASWVAPEGVTSNVSELYVDNVNFDTVTNFNVHRLNEESTESTSKYPLSVLTNEYKNAINSEDEYRINTWISKYNDQSNSENGVLTLESNGINANAAIVKIELDNSVFGNQTGIVDNAKYSLSSDANLLIDITSNLAFRIGVKGCCSNGRRPVLMSSSKIDLVLAYSATNGSNEETELIELDRVTYKFKSETVPGSAGDTWGNDSGREWVGYDKNGSSIANSVYSYKWRYYTYEFTPDKFSVNSSNSHFQKLREDINNISNANGAERNSKVTLYVIPAASITVRGEKYAGNPKKVIKDLSVSSIIPVISEPGEVYEKIIVNKKNEYLGNLATKLYNQNASNNTAASRYAKLSTNILATSEAIEDVKSATLCDNGMVIRAGDYTFGLGYAKNAGYMGSGDVKTDVPVLMYYKQNPKPEHSGNDAPVLEWEHMVHSIPLIDIIKTINIVHTKFADDWENTNDIGLPITIADNAKE